MELIGIKRRNIVKYFSVSNITFFQSGVVSKPELHLVVLQRAKLWKYIIELTDTRETVDIIFWSEDKKYYCSNCRVVSFSSSLDKDNWPDCHGEVTICGLSFLYFTINSKNTRVIKKAMMYAINEFMIPEKRQKLKIINH